jgi:D-alanyl-D-alanine carboxypeptidase
VDDEPLNFESSTSYEYSNSDNIVVGLMVEEATGEPYEQQLNEQVYKPLGLKKSSLLRGATSSRRSSTATTTTPPKTRPRT